MYLSKLLVYVMTVTFIFEFCSGRSTHGGYKFEMEK